MQIPSVNRLWLRLPALLCIGALNFIVLAQANPALVQAVSMGENHPYRLLQQPYGLRTGKNHPAALLLDIRYRRGQNAHFVIEPENGCVTHIFLSPPYTINKQPFCNRSLLDLSPYIKDGINQLALEVVSTAPWTEIYLSPQLWGAHMLSTLACAGIFSAMAAGIFLIAREGGLNIATSAIAVAGVAYFALLLHYRPNLSYSNDYTGHIAYIRYMVSHWMKPYGYWGWEDFHPPSYYLLAARFFTLGDLSWIINPLTAVRVFSLGLYMAFCIYGLRTLDDAAGKKGLTYYTGSLLIVFWPLSLIMATRINNDLAVYAAWGAAFYYLANWYRERDISSLRFAVAMTGITFMIKANAYILAAIMGSCVFFALCAKRLAWRELWQRRNIPAFCILLLGMAVSVSRVNHSYLGGAGNDFYPLSYFLSFDPRNFIAHPDLQYAQEPGYLNYFLKTALYGESHFSPALTKLAAGLNALLLILLFVTIFGIILYAARRRSITNLWPYLMAVLIAMAGSVTFMILKHYIFCQDFRYVLPMLVPFSVLFMRGMEAMRATALTQPLYWIGIASALALVAGGALLFLAAYGIINDGWLIYLLNIPV